MGVSSSCTTDLCNDIMKESMELNSSRMCEKNFTLGAQKLIFPKLNLNAVSVNKCYYCMNCTSFNGATIKTCNTTSDYYNYYSNGPFACQYTFSKLSNGTVLHNSDCVSTSNYQFSSNINGNMNISKTVACQSDMCNSPSVLKLSENSTLCSDGFYDNLNVTLPTVQTIMPTRYSSYNWYTTRPYQTNSSINCY